MSAALPLALRTRFQECIQKGLSSRAAAGRLKLPAATGVCWLRRLRETGSIRLSPPPRSPTWPRKVVCASSVARRVSGAVCDITLPELAEALEAATGVSAHAASIGRFPRKLGYTYKKVAGRHRTPSRPSEEAPMKLVQAPCSCDASAS